MKKLTCVTKLNDSNATSSISFVMLFSAIAFVLHFAWEYIQCTPFFIHVQNPPTLGGMIYAALGDVLMIWAVFLMMAVRYRSFAWFNGRWNLSSTLLIVGLSLFLAVLVELWALRTERWAYTENNPLLPILGISILPLIQMALINPISMFGSKIILTSLAKAKPNSKEPSNYNDGI